jgi:branched-chain amino acid transport system permease protein
VILFELLKEWLSGKTPYWYGLLGMVFILATIYFPKGVLGEARRLATRRPRSKP